MNSSAFFFSIRGTLFGGKLRQGTVDTVNAILTECNKRNVHDYRHVAYILATAYHESYNARYNPDWKPVREGFTNSDKGAIDHITNLFQQGRIKRNYALPVNGLSYYGRGWVQVTHYDNYRRLSDIYNIDLLNSPDKALERPVAATLLVDGMKEGWYTGHNLYDYITSQNTDFIGARRVINGQDKAAVVSGYAMKFYEAMIQL